VSTIGRPGPTHFHHSREANYLAAFVVSTAFVESQVALQESLTLQESVTGVVASVLAPELQAANANATAATRMNFFMCLFSFWFLVKK